MNISATSIIADNTYSVAGVSRKQPYASPQQKQTESSDKVTFSKEAQSGTVADSAVLDTSQGSMSLNIDSYFAPTTNTYSMSNLPPLLFPSLNNINAISKHISAAMPQF